MNKCFFGSTKRIHVTVYAANNATDLEGSIVLSTCAFENTAVSWNRVLRTSSAWGVKFRSGERLSVERGDCSMRLVESKLALLDVRSSKHEKL